MKPLFREYERVHLVGIGGAGMEGLARVLRQLGCHVSGSDQSSSPAVEQLRREGVEVHLGHRAAQVGDAELVVYSAAVPPDNEELLEAAGRGIAAAGRATVLGELTRSRYTIGVAGSHGKTTTASMLAAILERGGCEPSVLIGGWMGGRAQAHLGSGDLFVVEADEFDRSFLALYPAAAIVSNIDAEHLDCYRDLHEVQQTFLHYLGRLPFYGHCLLNGDDPGVQGILGELDRERLTYGLRADNHFRGEGIQREGWGSRFDLCFRARRLTPIELRVPGEHNVANAVGAAGMAYSLGVHPGKIRAALQDFRGVDRRFQTKGEVGEVLVVDDYAHHPTEVTATLAATRDSGRRVVAIFQPHLYSRTRDCWEEFARALQGADQVFVTDIYGSREEPLPGIHAGLISEAMVAQGYAEVEYIPCKGRIAGHVLETCRPGDLVMTLGAGDVGGVADQVLEGLRARSA